MVIIDTLRVLRIEVRCSFAPQSLKGQEDPAQYRVLMTRLRTSTRVHTGVLPLICVSLSIHRQPTTDDPQDISLFLDSLSS